MCVIVSKAGNSVLSYDHNITTMVTDETMNDFFYLNQETSKFRSRLF